MKPRAYSYIRFSSTEQASGDSLRRQTDAAKRYAAANGMELDEALTMQDLGRSAYAGHHITEGALGVFLAACESGLVPKGSTLIVESVDRLTRLDHLEAVTLIGRLVKHVSLHVVQLGRTFTDDTVRHDMGAIFTLIGAITLGHQESRQKSHRVGQAWEQKRQAALKTGTKLTSKCPAWLRNTPHGFEPIPARVKIVQDIFERFAAGGSQEQITFDLNNQKVPVWGRGARWSRSYVFKILTSEATQGILKMGRKRKIDTARIIVETVPDYYPVTVDPTLFAEAARRVRTGTKGRQTTQNPLQGVLRCPHCDGKVIREWKGERARAKLVCAAVRTGSGTPSCSTVRTDLKIYWDTFQATIADRAQAAAAAYHPAPINTLRRQAEESRAELESIRADIETLSSPSPFLIGQVVKLESQVQRLEEEIREAARDVNLGWENLRDALADPTTTPAEMSARLRVIFPNGIAMEGRAA